MGVGSGRGGGTDVSRENETYPFMFIHQQFNKGDNLNFAYRLLAIRHLHTYVRVCTNKCTIRAEWFPSRAKSGKNSLK